MLGPLTGCALSVIIGLKDAPKLCNVSHVLSDEKDTCLCWAS